MHNIVQFINPYKNANTFVIEINDQDIIIIDLGNYPVLELYSWISNNNKNLMGLFLTHEHADHCYGVDKLKDYLDFDLYCSSNCYTNIQNPKNNFSRYIEDFENFSVQSKAQIIKDKQILHFKKLKLEVLETPGHSPGSICLLLENKIFTGDSFFDKALVPLSFPHSNKLDYYNSKQKILNYIRKDTLIYPGHGDPFLLNQKLI